MKKALLIIALASLAFASTSFAQTPPPGVDRVGLYSGQFNGPTWANITPANVGLHPVYLIAHNISEGGISGYELKVHINGPAGSYNLVGTTLFGQGALNAAPYPYEFYVGFGVPMITPTGGQGTYVLAQMNFFIMTMDPIILRIGPVEYYRPSIEGTPVYVGPIIEGDVLRVLTPSSGSVEVPVFGFNTGPLDPPIAVDDETWGGIKGMFR